MSPNERRSQWGSCALLMRLAADRKKLLMQPEVMVLEDCSFLLEGVVSKRFEEFRSIGPTGMTCWGQSHSQLLSLAVAAAYEIVMKDMRMDFLSGRKAPAGGKLVLQSRTTPQTEPYYRFPKSPCLHPPLWLCRGSRSGSVMALKEGQPKFSNNFITTDHRPCTYFVRYK